MSLEIVTIPCLTDNYAFLLHCRDTGRVGLVDAPEAEPVLAALRLRGLTLHEVFLTHHHWDHVDGLAGLRTAFPNLAVTGAAADRHRLPDLDRAVSEGDTFEFGAQRVDVLDVSGHTMGHIAFHMPQAKAVFTADSLMALGCGRLFEGSPDTMWQSMQKLMALPPETTVCSGHEYTLTNARFALTIEPDNAALQQRAAEVEAASAAGQATVPSPLSLELATNPFLRAGLPEVKSAISMQNAGDAAVFAEIRARKDRF